jgi:inner membrane protein
LTSKTHLAVGCAAALFITSPDSLSELITCLGISSIGSVISDVDASRSESRKNLRKITAVTVIGTAAILASDHFLNTSVIPGIRNNSELLRMVTGFLIFIGICIFGTTRPHRSFMHSLAGTAAITLSFAVIIPSSAVYMAIPMLSHILIDMLNKKGVRILYPLKKPMISFDICYSDGIVNKLLFFIATAASVLKTGLILADIFGH